MSPPPPPPPPPPSSVVSLPAACCKEDRQSRDDSQGSADEVKQTLGRLPSWRQQSFGEPIMKWIACNQQIKHISQQGPTCGLVALCMAANMLDSSLKSLDTILIAARSRGYTIQGEMFSASNTLKFAEEEFGMKGRLLSGDLHVHKDEIMNHLARGLPVIVPYDKDSNNEPATKKGHSAHWAILTGFVLAVSDDVEVPTCYHSDQSSTILTYLPPPWSDDAISSLPHLLSHASQVFVFARQGKSRLLGAWQYDILARSNGNLREYDPSLQGEYVFEQEGLAAGLAEKVILLNRSGSPSGR